MNRLVAEQLRQNAMSRDKWELFAPHRQEVTRLLTRRLQPKAARLCVLGAGNCNDLDLAVLTDFFREVHLVDLDGQAIAEGVARQHITNCSKLQLHGDVDVTGVLDLLAKWSPDTPPTETEVNVCVEQATLFPGPDLPGPFDVVTSVCLLTQLLGAVVLTLGTYHPLYVELLLSIRTRHLRLLTESVSPGGVGILVTDIVSSETFPDMASILDAEFPKTVMQIIQDRNFFDGVNPFVLESLFRTDPTIAPLLARLQLVRPWRWNLGSRIYAVCAIKFQRRNYL